MLASYEGHVWTYASAPKEVDTSVQHLCPCIATSTQQHLPLLAVATTVCLEIMELHVLALYILPSTPVMFCGMASSVECLKQAVALSPTSHGSTRSLTHPQLMT